MKKRKRVCDRGYENKNVAIRRAKDGAFPFLFFSALFGAAVYLVASALCKAALAEILTVNAFSFVL